jgi:hypothetical protein
MNAGSLVPRFKVYAAETEGVSQGGFGLADASSPTEAL